MNWKKNLQLLTVTVLVGLVTLSLHSQVTIGSGLEPVGGALLDLKEQDKGDGSENATKGVMLPRVELSDLNKLYPMFTGTYDADQDTKHTGLTVYNLNKCDGKFAQGVYTWTGTEWVQLTNNPILTGGNPVLALPQPLIDNNYLVRIPSGQDLRAAWIQAYAPEITFTETNRVTGAWSNTISGGLVFNTNPLVPAFPATWTISPINDVSIRPEAMTTTEVGTGGNPWLTRESKLTVTGIAGTGPCPGGTDQSQVITLNQTNYAIIPGIVANPTSLLVLRAIGQQSLNILSNARWQATASAGTVPYTDILSTYTTAQTGSERHDNGYNTNPFNYTSTNPVTQGKKYETAQITFSDTENRAKPVTITVMQCQGTEDLSGVTTTATPAETSGTNNWGTAVVRHQTKPGVYEEFYSADFGSAGRWMTTNLAATAYDWPSGTPPALGGVDASTSYVDPRWCYPKVTGTVTAGESAPPTWYSQQGLLYNWPAATGKQNPSTGYQENSDHPSVQGICPNGWHLPSDKEWNQLEAVIYEHPENYSSYADNSSFPTTTWDPAWNTGHVTDRPSFTAVDAHGKAMKEICGLNGTVPDGLSKNIKNGGFSVLLTGGAEYDETFYFGDFALFWGSSSNVNRSAWYRRLSVYDSSVQKGYSYHDSMFSVRCKKD